MLINWLLAVIGTPFWMAPEVIQEIGYDCVADIWSLGITALEMAEGKAPYAEIHPMRAIFMIPTKPPPSFHQPDRWSPAFIDFVSRCLVKNPDSRATASELLQHEFIQNAKSPEILNDMIREAQTTKEQIQNRVSMVLDDDSRAGTMVPGDSGTLVREGSDLEADQGTMVEHPTLTRDDPQEDSGSMIELESNLGTMVINEDDEDTMQSNAKSFIQVHHNKLCIFQGMGQPRLATDQNFLTISTRKLTPKLTMKVDNRCRQLRLKPHQVQKQPPPSQDRCCKSSCNKLLGVNLSYKTWPPPLLLLRIIQPTTLLNSSNV